LQLFVGWILACKIPAERGLYWGLCPLPLDFFIILPRASLKSSCFWYRFEFQAETARLLSGVVLELQFHTAAIFSGASCVLSLFCLITRQERKHFSIDVYYLCLLDMIFRRVHSTVHIAQMYILYLFVRL